ncbi:hypothetical protein [Winogradskya consettensis]|nr:hypothetical protein [Actinoplanes consettensis]
MRRILAALFATAALATTMGCSDDPDPVGASKRQPADAAEVEHVGGVHLPSGTKLLYAESAGFADTDLWAVFRLPTTALDGFLSDGKLPKPVPGLRTAADSFTARDGLDPKAAVTVSGIDEYTDAKPGTYPRMMMFDLDQPGEVTVYLRAETT